MNPAYLDTYFLGSFDLVGMPEHFFIITACNPMDQKLEDSENKKRNQKLLSTIKKTSALCLPLIGTSKNLSHQEPSYLVETSKNQAIQWGKQFNQRAIFEIEKDKLLVIPCNEKEGTVYIGSFAERCRVTG